MASPGPDNGGGGGHEPDDGTSELAPDRRCYSSWLPPLPRDAPYARLLAAIQELHLLTSTRPAQTDSTEEVADDTWEKTFAINWLTRLLSLAVRRSATIETAQLSQLKEDGEHLEDDDWEALSSYAGDMLAGLTGTPATASQAFTRKYVFSLDLKEVSDPQPGNRIDIQVREVTLSYPAIGCQTWNSAQLMCRRMSSDPLHFFPQMRPPVALRLASAQRTPETPPLTRPSSPFSAAPRRTLKVLELGSGTGLVGITAATILAHLAKISSYLAPVDIDLVLSDYQTDVLANLEHNVEINRAGFRLPDACQSTLSVKVVKLDWREVQGSELAKAGLRGCFDVVLGSDLVYEPDHALWASNAVKYFLRPETDSIKVSRATKLGQQKTPEPSRPSSPCIRMPLLLPCPTFHLLLPLRPTFIKESEAVHRAFGGRDMNELLDPTDAISAMFPVHDCTWEESASPTKSESVEIYSAKGLQIKQYVKEEGVRFGQGCGEYQYLQIGWRVDKY